MKLIIAILFLLFAIAVSVAIPVLVSGSPPPYVGQGLPYYSALSASGGIWPYTYSTNSGTIPPGITVSSGGIISGSSTNLGTYGFMVEATDSSGNIGYCPLSIDVIRNVVVQTNLPTTVNLIESQPLSLNFCVNGDFKDADWYYWGSGWTELVTTNLASYYGETITNWYAPPYLSYTNEVFSMTKPHTEFGVDEGGYYAVAFNPANSVQSTNCTVNLNGIFGYVNAWDSWPTQPPYGTPAPSLPDSYIGDGYFFTQGIAKTNSVTTNTTVSFHTYSSSSDGNPTGPWNIAVYLELDITNTLFSSDKTIFTVSMFGTNIFSYTRPSNTAGIYPSNIVINVPSTVTAQQIRFTNRLDMVSVTDRSLSLYTAFDISNAPSNLKLSFTP